MDEPEPAQPHEPETDDASSTDGNSEQDNREMYEALDDLNMLPFSHAMPISMVFPETAGSEQAKKQAEASLETTAATLL